MKKMAKGKWSNIINGESSTKYKIGFIIIASIVASAILVFVYANISQEEPIIGINEAEDIQITELGENQDGILEQASTQIGKNISEVKEDEKKPIIINDEEDNSKVVHEIKEVSEENSKNQNKVEKSENSKSADSKNSNNKSANEVNTANQGNLEKLDKIENKEQEIAVEPTFSMPAQGQIIKDYAKDTLVYSDTLKEWITHGGIDIKAEKTSVVKASEKGKIKSIKNDPRFGLTVVIEHANNYSTVYSNLLTAEFVKVGEQVEKGQTIGTVGDTATFEMADEPHIHFEILKDNVQINPNMYIK